MDPAWQFRRFSDRSAALGESPLWSEDEGCLWWVDIEGQRLLCSEAAGGATREWTAPGPIACHALLPDGDLLAGIGRGLFRFERSGGRFLELARLETDLPVRFNDGALDPAGRFWAGTMDLDNRAPIGALYRIGQDLRPRQLFEGLLTPNGLAFDAERGRLYLSDSHATVRTVWCCDYDAGTGEVGERRVFARFTEADGRPDGAAIDAEGNYWIAATDAAALLCFAPDGSLRRRVAVPVTHPTKPAFGGAGLRTLYLTSRRIAPRGDGLDRESGFLLAASSEVAGRPEGRFRLQEK